MNPVYGNAGLFLSSLSNWHNLTCEQEFSEHRIEAFRTRLSKQLRSMDDAKTRCRDNLLPCI